MPDEERIIIGSFFLVKERHGFRRINEVPLQVTLPVTLDDFCILSPDRNAFVEKVFGPEESLKKSPQKKKENS